MWLRGNLRWESYCSACPAFSPSDLLLLLQYQCVPKGQLTPLHTLWKCLQSVPASVLTSSVQPPQSWALQFLQCHSP